MMYDMKPIGYLRSPFKFKNGTPRQATVCRQAKGSVTIDKSIFNNPEHSLEGLETYTHVWIMFVFHQNNNDYTKAKVKPPRLNGRRVGLFSTRSPYRPNNIGLTLAKIEGIKGATLTVSGVDILDGSPVLDLKPYIPQYDCPALFSDTTTAAEAETDPGAEVEHEQVGSTEPGDINSDRASVVTRETAKSCHPGEESTVDFMDNISNISEDEGNVENGAIDKVNVVDDASGILSTDSCKVVVSDETNVPVELKTSKRMKLEKSEMSSSVMSDTSAGKEQKMMMYDLSPIDGEKVLDKTDTASWVVKPPVSTLSVRFTPSSEKQLKRFSGTTSDDHYRLNHLEGSEEARKAILSILHEDPRSTYRRKQCVDNLYYFTVDIVHVTAWFDDDDNVVEVVRVKPAATVQQCKHKFATDNV